MHLSVYYSAAVSNTVGTHTVPAVNDGFINVQNGAFVFPRDCNLLASASVNTVYNRNHLDHDPWRGESGNESQIVNINGNTFASDWMSVSGNAVRLIKANNSLFWKYSRVTLGASVCHAGVLTDINKRQPTGGQCVTIALSGSLTTVAGAWVTSVPALTLPLPFGTYAMVGSKVRMLSAIAGFFRWRFQSQDHMPGGPVVSSSGSEQYPRILRYPGIETWGSFTESSLPIIEFNCSSSATVSYMAYVDLIKTR